MLWASGGFPRPPPWTRLGNSRFPLFIHLVKNSFSNIGVLFLSTSNRERTNHARSSFSCKMRQVGLRSNQRRRRSNVYMSNWFTHQTSNPCSSLCNISWIQASWFKQYHAHKNTKNRVTLTYDLLSESLTYTVDDKQDSVGLHVLLLFQYTKWLLALLLLVYAHFPICSNAN